MIGTDVDVKVSERAVTQIQKLMEMDSKHGQGLRVGVKSGGCSGLSYFMEFQAEPLANDKIFEFDGGVKLFVDVFSVMYLDGSELDFTDGLNGTGFEWSNPNAARTCGCGQSFSA